MKIFVKSIPQTEDTSVETSAGKTIDDGAAEPSEARSEITEVGNS